MYKNFFIGSNGFRDIYVCECGVRAYDAANGYPSGYKDDYGAYLIHYVFKGKGQVIHVSKKGKLLSQHTVSEGQIFFIAPEGQFDYHFDKADPWHYFWVAFKGILDMDFIESLGLLSDPVKDILNKQDLEKCFLELLETVEAEKEDESYKFNFAIAAKMYNLMSVLSAECKNPASIKNKQEELFSEAEMYIRLRIKKKITVEEIAEKLCIDRSYLYSLFKKQAGISPSEYITKVKIDKACELLRNDMNKSIKEVSYLVGYESPNHFSKKFNKVKGVSPTKWRELHPDISEDKLNQLGEPYF